ncbi:MAG: hypothetical protein AAFW68_01005 [Pseudomonadota bacterium]
MMIFRRALKLQKAFDDVDGASAIPRPWRALLASASAQAPLLIAAW